MRSIHPAAMLRRAGPSIASARPADDGRGFLEEPELACRAAPLGPLHRGGGNFQFPQVGNFGFPLTGVGGKIRSISGPSMMNAAIRMPSAPRNLQAGRLRALLSQHRS